ncbi:MAG: hypothetical protein RQ966_09755 [Acetobacteraceae bacterium]|nr:hypothetical protein [Acetobacteraceae bacterium]
MVQWPNLFGRGEPADGASLALEQVATGVGPALLGTAEASAAQPAGRRERAPDAGSAVIAEVLGAKLIHGWLQNRHQTLMPLTFNLAILTGEQQATLAHILASLLLAGRPADAAAEFAPVLRTWLADRGAGPDALAAFDDGMERPLPLNEMFDQAQAGSLAIHAYVAALMATDARYPVSALLCDVIQSRFSLPTALVRSAIRRYRR